MAEQEQTYDDGRARNLEALLRALAERIRELDNQGRLLEQAGELMKLIGDVRMPAIAAPMPAPVKPDSDSGVSLIRSGPNSASSPWLTA